MGSNDVGEIYDRMAVIRRERHTNVRESVAGAEAVADWGRYTWTYPSDRLGAATTAGYLLYKVAHPRASGGTPQTWPICRARRTDRASQGQSSGTIKHRPESPGRRLGHHVPRRRTCGSELPAALARRRIPDDDDAPDRCRAARPASRRMARPTRSTRAVSHKLGFGYCDGVGEQRTPEGCGYRDFGRSCIAMVDQASENGRGTARAPGSGSAEFEGVAEFVDDLASLAELQARLLAIDCREAARKSAMPIVVTVVGLAVLVASFPVALLVAGWLLASALKIHQGWAMLATSGAAMALGD